MMKYIGHGLKIAFLLALGACATSNDTGPKTQMPVQQQEVRVEPLGDDEVLSHFSILPAQVLADGECGQFLWLKREDAPLIFFQRSDGQATMMVDGQVTLLERQSKAGRIAQEYYEQQEFSARGISLTVSVKPEGKRSFQKGLKLPIGSVAVKTVDGWSAVLPVVGLIGCK
ncbi:MAG: hypothetical protein HWE08_01325 [Alphaproteobacteria bacterium]|nr:hypothetical protein [Alphaproteobacteria bacterium]